MDEQRFQDYWSLIQELLSCPSGEECDILQRHSNLVDEGLVWVMVQVAERMAEVGNPNADCLRRFTAQLAQLIGNWKQLYQRATQLYHQGQYSQAVIVAEQALALARQLWGDEHFNTVASLNNLALLYHLQGCLAAAESLYKAALAMIKRLFPTDHPDVAQSLNNLAGLLASTARYSEALELIKEAAAIENRLISQAFGASSEGRGEEESYSPLLASYSPLLAGEGQGERSTAELLETLTSSTFERTKGTRLLGESVAKLLGVSPYLGKEALASRLTGCESPEILLIATHGLFSREAQLQEYWNLITALLTCPDGQKAELLQKNRKLLDKTLLEVMEKVAAILAEDGYQNAAGRLRNFAPQVAAIIDKSTQQTPIQNPPNSPYQGGNFKIPNPEDPMLRSALAFAGANAWLQGKTLPNEAGKGLVFAQDVAALDLWATELAVLSACNTAMGDIKIGEGVFGLRRAFAVAGAKTLVMSLWSVPDRATALLMERFFTNLQQGLGRADALQDAQNYIRTITVKDLQQSPLGLAVLEELEKLLPQDYQFCQDNRPLEHPYFWGAWVCQGDTTAMVKSQACN